MSTSSPPRPWRRHRLGLALAVGALGAAACTSSSASEPSTTDTSMTITVPSTRSTTSEPEEPTTSETTLEDVEAAVREVHTRFMTELFDRDERIVGPEAILVLAEELTTGRVLARLQDSVTSKAESGERTVSPGFESNIVGVTLDGDTAVTLDCSRDQAERFSADGELLVESEAHFTYTETWLVFENGKWLVEEFIVGGDLPCDPETGL